MLGSLSVAKSVRFFKQVRSTKQGSCFGKGVVSLAPPSQADLAKKGSSLASAVGGMWSSAFLDLCPVCGSRIIRAAIGVVAGRRFPERWIS